MDTKDSVNLRGKPYQFANNVPLFYPANDFQSPVKYTMEAIQGKKRMK